MHNFKYNWLWRFLLAVLLCTALAAAAAGAGSGAAVLTDGTVPVRGWNSWNTFRCHINETLIQQVADALVSSGLREAGYVYVNIDDCWMERRDEHGVLQPFASKFPSGMKALADYVHSRGLKLGLYSDAGNKTCEGYPGSWGHAVQDAATFAAWGVDYLKYDYCGMPQERQAVKAAYHSMSAALAQSGRPLLLSMCSWGAGQPWEWAQGVAASWRVSPDLFAAWDREQAAALYLPAFLISVMEVADIMADKAAAARPGSFNDADMIVVGLDGMTPYGVPASNKCPPHVAACTPGEYISREAWGAVGGLTFTQQHSHFSLWVMMSSPLILGNDPRLLRSNVRDMLTAPEILAIHGDALGRQAQRIHSMGPLQLWRRELSGSSRFALLVLNTKGTAIDFTEVLFQQHFAEMHAAWARNLSGQQLQPRCEDEDVRCIQWAANGECSRNPGFMLSSCKKSCPKGCTAHATLLASGLVASALVRDAWEREDLGLAVGRLQVKHLEPYEGRVFVLQFVDTSGLGAGVGGLQALAGGGVSGTAGYTRPTTSALSSRSSITVVGGSVQFGLAAAEQGKADLEAAAAVPGNGASAVEMQGRLQECQQQIVQLTARAQQMGDSLVQSQHQLRQGTQAAATAAALKVGTPGAAAALHRTGSTLTSNGRSRSSSSSTSQEAGQVPAAAAGFEQPSQQHVQQHALGDNRWLSSLGVNVCVLCLGILVGAALHRHRWRRHGLGGLHKQQQHIMKLY